MNFSSSFDKRYSIANGSIIQKVAFILAVKGQFRGADGRAEDWNYQATLLWAQVSGTAFFDALPEFCL